MAKNDEKMIFGIGFDLATGVDEVIKQWNSKEAKRIQKAIDARPFKIKLDFDANGIKMQDFKRWMALSREAEKLERERIKNAREWQKVADQQAMAETRRANAINESNARIERQNRKTNASYKTQSGYLQRLFQRMVAYASVAQAFSFVRNVRDVTAEFELQRVALGSIIGDLNEANAMFEQIKAAAVKSPFQIKELVTYTKQLAAYKIESDELFETTQKLADISAGLGVGMERLVLAYGQIRATGYLRASEVRQLTEAGIPIVEELAKKMSQLRGETVSAAEVMGLISERAISFGMVKEVFDDMTSAGGMFYKMQEKQAETLAGQWSNLQDAIAIMYEEIGNTEGVNNSIKGMIGLVKSLAENWRDVYSVAQSLSVAMGVYYVAMKNATVASKALSVAEATRLSTLRATTVYMPKFLASTKLATTLTRAYRVAVIKSATATGLLSKSFWKLTAAMLSNPYTAVLAVLASLATLLLTTENRAKRLNKELAKIGTEGALQADQSVRNFERLAKTIRESADGSREQSEALAELKRTYGDLLPAQDKEILALVKVKEGYEDVTTAIREKINAQIYEEKMNTIISEYGTNLANKQKKPKKWLENMGFSAEETTRIFNAIDKAVQEGLIKVEDDVVTQARKIEKIIKDQTGKVVNLTESQYARVAGTNQTIYTGEKATRLANKLSNLVGFYSDFNNSVNELANSQKRASNITWEYQEGYDKLKDSIAETNAQFNESTFAGSEFIKANTLAKWREYFISLSDIFAKTPEGGIVDFTDLEDEIEKLPANLRAHIRVVQKEYEKLIPTDITRLANDKLQEYADKVGISMDDVKEHLKNNEQSTEDWANGLKGAYESAEKKLAEYKLNRDNAISIGKKSHWSKEVEKVEDEMKVLKLLMEFFKEFLKGSDTKQRKSQLSILQEELQLHEKIYAKYKEYRKYMSAEEAKAKVEDYFGDTIDALKFKPSFDKSGYQGVLEQYKKEANALLAKAKDETEKAAIKKFLLEIGFKIGDKDWEETKDDMEKNLKDLSDKLSRTKTAKEFFDRMLGMTGDKELSASLTVSIYGGEMGDDLGERLAKDMATKFQEQVQTYFGNIDISSAINEATGEIDPIKLEKLLTEENIKKMGKDNVIEVRKIINDLIKANADYATELFKSYEKFFDYEKRMTMVTQREEEERKKIRESMIPNDQKAQLEEASKKREQEQISAIEIEQLKDTADWEKTFEDLNNLGSLTVKNLISLLEDYIAKKKEAGKPIAESDMKTLMNELNQLRERDAQLDPFATIKASLKDLTDATKEYNKAKENGDEKGMADAQNKRAKALNKLETAVNAVASGFQNLSNLLTEFQELLGIEDDSNVGEVLNGAAKALGFVATALSTVIALTLLWNSTLWKNPLFASVAIVSGVLGAVAGVFSAIDNAKVSKADRDIEALNDRLDSLSYAYGRLQKDQEKVFGTEYIQNYQHQLENLEAQQEAYLKQAEKERSKGKKADEDKIKEYKRQAQDAEDAIADMYGSLSTHFLGTDITSAARDFAQAWIEAYKEFSNTTDAMKAKFQDMIQNMVVESLLAKVMERALEPVFKMIDEMQDGDFYSPNFWQGVMDKVQKATTDSTIGAENIMSMLEQMGINLRGLGGEMTGISRDIATASEESVLGLAAGINTQNFYISQVPTKLDTIIGLLRGNGIKTEGSTITLQDVMIAQNQFLSHLPTIAQHTAETVAECKQIVAETRRTADVLERVIKPDGTRTPYKLNVVTTYQG